MQPADWAGSAHAAIEEYHRRGWTDGLPVVPPTEDLIKEFLAAAGLGEDDTAFSLPERRRTVSAGKVALNAVMAVIRSKTRAS